MEKPLRTEFRIKLSQEFARRLHTWYQSGSQVDLSLEKFAFEVFTSPLIDWGLRSVKPSPGTVRIAAISIRGNGREALSPEEVEDLLEVFDDEGLTYAALAERFHISQPAVFRLLSRYRPEQIRHRAKVMAASHPNKTRGQQIPFSLDNSFQRRQP